MGCKGGDLGVVFVAGCKPNAEAERPPAMPELLALDLQFLTLVES
jgi:hypothetical protein